MGPIPQPATTLALFNDTDPLVVVAFYNYDGISMEGAIASSSPRWFGHREFIRACFRYVFEQEKCKRFVVRVDESNKRAHKFDLQLGFVHEGTLRQAASDGGDVHVLAMLKEEYEQSKWKIGK